MQGTGLLVDRNDRRLGRNLTRLIVGEETEHRIVRSDIGPVPDQSDGLQFIFRTLKGRKVMVGYRIDPVLSQRKGKFEGGVTILRFCSTGNR